MQPCLVAENADARLCIYYDPDAENPRTGDNLGTMVCWHDRHDLGDKHVYSDPQAFLEILATEFGMREERAINSSAADLLAYIQRRGVLILPLYLYDHSGITMRTTPFSCRWDSGQVGWIYVTPAVIRKEYSCKRITAKARDLVEKVLLGEVQVYDQYLRGDVYGFELEDKKSGESDSCWCFFGSNMTENSIAWHLSENHRGLLLELKAPEEVGGGVYR